MTERKLLTSENIGAVNRYYYDANGNRVRKTTGSYNTTISHFNLSSAYPTRLGIYGQGENSGYTTERYTYDAFNQLTKVTSNGTTLAEYTYLPNGLRHSKNVNGNKKYFAWDGDQIEAELNANNVVTSRYIYGTERICNTSNNTYYMYNNHGDVSDITDANGNVTKTYGFFGSDAFGDEKNPDSADTNPFRYCGEYYDTETGYTYLRARYYDPSVGAFINEDPIRDGVNWYSYCTGNPIMFFDPSGCVIYYLYNEYMHGKGSWNADEMYRRDKKTIEEELNVDDDEIICIKVNNNDDLKKALNQVGYDESGNAVDVDAVVINIHGGSDGMSFVTGSYSDEKKIKWQDVDINVFSALQEKNAGTIFLYSCSTAGEFDGGDNVAETILDLTGAKVVIAPTRTIYTSSTAKNGLRIATYDEIKPTEGTKTTIEKGVFNLYFNDGSQINLPSNNYNGTGYILQAVNKKIKIKEMEESK